MNGLKWPLPQPCSWSGGLPLWVRRKSMTLKKHTDELKRKFTATDLPWIGPDGPWVGSSLLSGLGCQRLPTPPPTTTETTHPNDSVWWWLQQCTDIHRCGTNKNSLRVWARLPAAAYSTPDTTETTHPDDSVWWWLQQCTDIHRCGTN